MAEKLSRRERQIMDALYEQGRISARDVQDALPEAPGYSAVRALLARLVEKGEVISIQEGQRLLYHPAKPLQQARGSALKRLVSTFFGGSGFNAATALLEQEELKPDELEKLQRLIDQARKRD
ncbi:BlaI/MecI/CopY family transcriptional regulator [Zhongshania sp. BJYM1]|uniref:BlaI/MecI/CopY family transcriptional regulator n=1 Tax=Zhongshania aquatica TaxID=2965069 RepID=UPI0022B59EAF|nr:BlaI/MecI/CopY family transcriptional regulator [Marortus sp. BJYM1]